MSGKQRRYISYLLRLWQTEREGALVWCASLESPATGERRGFAGMADLYAFLGQETAPLDRDDAQSLVGGDTNVPKARATEE
jgi:hypothetical protein